MATQVDICNWGLALIGANPITSFADGSVEANLCQSLYPILQDDVLSARAWTFATTKTLWTSGVPPNPLPPTAGWAYLMPSDCLRIIRIFNPLPMAYGFQDNTSVPEAPDNQVSSVGFEVLERWAYTQFVGPTAWVKWIQRITDPMQYSPGFISALAQRIAMELAMPITNNPEIYQSMMKLYAAKIQDASSTEGQQGTAVRIRARTLASKRS